MIKAILYFSFAVIAFSSGWVVNGTRLNLKREKEITSAYARQAIIAKESEESRYKLETTIKAKNNEISKLRSDLDLGNKRLRIATKPSAITPAGACGAEVSTEELDSSARQAYLDLRAGIIETESILNFCIETVKQRSEKD
jgi:hypothetical protein